MSDTTATARATQAYRYDVAAGLLNTDRPGAIALGTSIF